MSDDITERLSTVAGGMELDGFEGEQFAAVVVYDNPTDLNMKMSVVWDATPVEIITINHKND